MKTKLFFLGMLFFNLSFGQNNSNGPVSTNLANSNLINPMLPLPQSAEIFRFRPGLVTQLDDPLNLNFGFTNSRWFSIGSLNTGSQTIYGLRFQLPNKAVTFGYQNITDINPRIQWISNAPFNAVGNLEFRAANSFTSTSSNLIASMNGEGSVFIGREDEASEARTRLKIENNGFSNVNGSIFGIISQASNAEDNIIGVYGSARGTGTFGAGVYGANFNQNAANQWAGYFDGRVFGTAFVRPSDNKFKIGIEPEPPLANMQRLMQLKPVTYKFKQIAELNLPQTKQHGFIAQDVEKVFPELVTEISKPVFDKSGKVTSTFTFKAVEYEAMNSMLVAAVQELNTELQLLKEEIATLKSSKSERKSLTGSTLETKGAFMQQNIPNPFADQTTITYQLPEGKSNAEIIVFDLTGKLIKTYAVNKNQSELIIKAADIGSGLFIYSLVQDG